MSTTTAVKARPILFSAPMVRAILDGRKSVTRRLSKLRDPSETYAARDDDGWPVSADQYGDWHRDRCPYGAPGDVLYVREALMAVKDTTIGPSETMPICAYRADGTHLWTRDAFRQPWRWQRATLPAIHMPRWASRITLRVTDVRVERLQAITEDEAEREGVGLGMLPENVVSRVCRVCGQHRESHLGALHVCSGHSTTFCVRSYRDGFAILWDQINGAGSWASDPLIWRVAFEREDESCSSRP